MVEAVLSELHGLIFDHLVAAGMSEELLVQFRKELSGLSGKCALESKLFRTFQYVRTGDMDLVVVSLSGASHAVHANKHMRVRDLKTAIELVEMAEYF